MHAMINELSLVQYPDKTTAAKNLNAFSDLIRMGGSLGISGVAMPTNFAIHQFASHYTYFDWIQTVDSDLRTFLNGIVGTFPDLESLWLRCEDDFRILHSITNQEACIGLCLSSEEILNRICFSFQEASFDFLEYPIEITVLTEDGLSLVEEMVHSIARNSSRIEDLPSHREFLVQEALRTQLTGREIWLKRKGLFPNLEFCSKVERQISELHYSSPSFHAVLNRLWELQDVAIRFTDKPVTPSDFRSKASLESDSRLREFKNELIILCPDSIQREFSWHCRFTPGAGRIHFIPYEAEKRILVGSIANQNKIK
jgi:hypothetical protein